jgi:hypothetical protein
MTEQQLQAGVNQTIKQYGKTLEALEKEDKPEKSWEEFTNEIMEGK